MKTIHNIPINRLDLFITTLEKRGFTILQKGIKVAERYYSNGTKKVHVLFHPKKDYYEMELHIDEVEYGNYFHNVSKDEKLLNKWDKVLFGDLKEYFLV
jgi:hypothetical protein